MRRYKAALGRTLYRALRLPLERYLDRRPRVGCVLWHEGKVLLVKNTLGRQQWNLPGGGIKAGEPPAAAVRREVAEELGIRIRKLRDLGVIETPRGQRYLCYSARAPSREYRPHPLELLEAGWFDPQRLPSDCSPEVRLALDQQQTTGH